MHEGGLDLAKLRPAQIKQSEVEVLEQPQTAIPPIPTVLYEGNDADTPVSTI